MARQRLGQHFLGDAGWREEIARAIRVSRHSLTRPGESHENYCWIEIGAGHGEMTEYLAATGAPTYAVELDPPLVSKLQVLAKRYPNLTVVPGDVLKTDFEAIASGRRIKLYGNLPYYITSPILHRFFEDAGLIDEIHIVIQLEVALRLVALPHTRDYGYLSVLTQFYASPVVALELPPEAFVPPPEVSSALVSLRLPGANANLQRTDAAPFLEFARSCFAHKRKTLSNNLRGRFAAGALLETLSKLGLKPAARAEELSVSQLAELYKRLGESG